MLSRAPMKAFALDDGGSLAWREVGEGPALLLIHGWPLTGLTWRRLVPELSGFRCIVPDLLGLGESSLDGDLGAARQAAALEAFVTDLGLDRFAIVAQDTGAVIAQLLATAMPERVAGLVLTNTEMPGHRPPWIRLYQWATRLPGSVWVLRELLGYRWYRASDMCFGGCFTDMTLLDGDFHQLFVKPLIESPSRAQGAVRYLQDISWKIVDSTAELHKELEAPVLLVWGADDPTFPIEEARKMAEGMPTLRELIEVPGASLLVHEEMAEVVGAVARPMLREVLGQT